MAHSAAEGILAEEQAKALLVKKGYRILAQNVSFAKVGELDIVAEDGSTIVIVEVKYRSTSDYGHPLEAITKPKISKIVKATERFLCDNGLEDSAVRFDVVCVADGIIEHFENAFFANFI